MVDKVFAQGLCCILSDLYSVSVPKLIETSDLKRVLQMVLRRKVQLGPIFRNTHFEQSHVDVRGVGLLTLVENSY